MDNPAAVSVKTPGQVGIGSEPLRIGQVEKVEIEFAVGRISVPEALSAAEIGQPEYRQS
jgi:hypothetical protein